MEPKGISSDTFDRLVHYFKYAASAYSPLCPRPNGKLLVAHFSDPSGEAIAGFVARDLDRKELVIAFRGSASAADILLDTQITLVPLLSPGVVAPHGTRVHSGFLVAWNLVVLQVLEIVTEQLTFHPSLYRIVTSGHSLGGALSTLAAISMKQNFPRCVVSNYSYGAPRLGNKIFSEFVNGLLGCHAYRVVHSHDGVPTMIPTSLGYYHHGVEYWQFEDPPSNETVLRCSADGEDPQCSASIPSGGVNDAHLTYFGIVATTPFCL